MITEATVRMAHLYPELVPDTAEVNIAAGYEAVPPILDLRRFSPLLLQLKDIAVERDDQVEVRIAADKTRAAIVAGSLTGNPNAVLGGIAPNRFGVLGRESLYYNLFSTALKANFRSYFGLWVYKPTVAHKLKMGMTLTNEERRISEELGIKNTVEKGLLPLPLSLQIEREYQIIDEITYGRILTVPTIPGVVVDTIHPRIDEFLVLTKIATDPGTIAEDVRLTIDRDDDANYVSLIDTYPLSLDFDLDCFIPALTEIRLSLIAAAVTANFNIRYTVLRCKMNNIVRARWGLVTKDELPEPSLWDKVKGGIL